MVTLPVPERFEFRKRSIAAFCAQSLPCKELVMVVNGGTDSGVERLLEYVASLKRADIRVVTLPGQLNLGQLRNISVESATGDFLCHWDDDDLFHPERLERQLTALITGDHEGVLLSDVAQYFPQTRALYCTNWKATEAGGHPATLLVRRTAGIHYPTEGSVARGFGDDLQVALALRARGRLGFIAGMPYLYVYVCHGMNVWSAEHFRMLVSELAISRGLLQRREVELRAGFKPHDFGPGEVSVEGNNGPGFKIASAIEAQAHLARPGGAAGDRQRDAGQCASAEGGGPGPSGAHRAAPDRDRQPG
jgi:glycosyltransferase involved in cell wall biosynthesis